MQGRQRPGTKPNSEEERRPEEEEESGESSGCQDVVKFRVKRSLQKAAQGWWKLGFCWTKPQEDLKLDCDGAHISWDRQGGRPTWRLLRQRAQGGHC